MNTLGVTAAANILGVSPSTVKRLCAQGQLPYLTTAGGHRRFDLPSLQNVAIRHMVYSNESGNDSGTLPEIAELLQQLLDGNVGKILSWLDRAPTNRSTVAHFLDKVLSPALWQLGERWRTGSLQCFQVCIAIQTAQRMLESLNSKLPVQAVSRFTAVGGTIEGNHDVLAGSMVQIALKLVQTHPIHLGNNLPAEAVAKAAKRFEAKVVWVSHTHVLDVNHVIEWHDALAEALPDGVRVLVGGGALSPAIRHSLKCSAYYPSLSALINGES